MSKPFPHEIHYIVFKITDIIGVLTDDEQRELQRMGNKIAKSRERAGKTPFNAVVVEQDWPEFESTWYAIESRMAKEQKYTSNRALRDMRKCHHRYDMDSTVRDNNPLDLKNYWIAGAILIGVCLMWALLNALDKAR